MGLRERKREWLRAPGQIWKGCPGARWRGSWGKCILRRVLDSGPRGQEGNDPLGQNQSWKIREWELPLLNIRRNLSGNKEKWKGRYQGRGNCPSPPLSFLGIRSCGMGPCSNITHPCYVRRGHPDLQQAWYGVEGAPRWRIWESRTNGSCWPRSMKPWRKGSLECPDGG